MADKSKTVEIIFGAVDKTGTTFKNLSKNLNSFERNVGNVTGPIADVTGSILKLDAALAAAAVGLTAYGIKVSDEFGTAFGEISTLIGQPASDLGDFKSDLQSYAEQSTQSFDEITSATYNAISAGVNYSDAVDLMTQSEQLSLAGRAELGTTTKALVSTLNAFGVGMDQAADFSDIFFTIVQKGQTTLPELADSIGTVAPLAKQAGLEFDELGGAIAAITAGAGISTPEAMTALRAALTNIIKPSKEASDLAKELGIDFTATALSSKGLSGFLADVAIATGGNVETMSQLFPNVRALNAVLPLTGSAAGKFAEAMEAMANRSGNAQTAAKELENDLSLLGQTLKNNVTSAFISFGDNLTDETAGIIRSVSSMFNSLGEEIEFSDGAFAPLIGQLEGVFQHIQVKFEAIAKNLPEAFDNIDVSTLAGAFEDLGAELGDSFRAIFGDLDLTTVDGLSIAIQKVIDGFTALVKVTEGIFDGLEPLFELIGAGINEFDSLDESVKESIGRFLGLVTSLNTVLPLLGGLATVLGTVSAAVISISGAKGLVSLASQLNGISAIAAKAGKGGLIGAALFGAYETGAAIGEGLNSLGLSDWLSEQIEAVTDWRNSLFGIKDVNEVWEETSKKAQEVTETIKDQKAAQDDLNESREEEIINYDEVVNKVAAESEARQKLKKYMDDGIESQEKNAGALQELTDKTSKFAEETEKAAEASESFKEKMAEIASDERIAKFEANIEFDIAQLEADTDKAKAILENLGTSVESTGDVIGTLFGTLQDATGSKRFDLEKQIKKEEERRQDLFKQQKELTDAEIDLVREKAQALSRGDLSVKVSAEHLSPALQIVMETILEQMQVSMTREGLEALTGL